MAEWSKVHDWKSCVGQPPTVGSNPTLSAIIDPDGAVAQLGERQVRNLEVVGSIPICSTIFSGYPLVKCKILGRARWGDSGALYPQSAIAGLNSHPEVFAPLVRPEQSGAEDWILRNQELLNPVRTGR